MQVPAALMAILADRPVLFTEERGGRWVTPHEAVLLADRATDLPMDQSENDVVMRNGSDIDGILASVAPLLPRGLSPASALATALLMDGVPIVRLSFNCSFFRISYTYILLM